MQIKKPIIVLSILSLTRAASGLLHRNTLDDKEDLCKEIKWIDDKVDDKIDSEHGALDEGFHKQIKWIDDSAHENDEDLHKLVEWIDDIAHGNPRNISESFNRVKESKNSDYHDYSLDGPYGSFT